MALAILSATARSEAFQALKASLDMRSAALVEVEAILPSGFAELDRALCGGLPRGGIAILEGDPSSGRMAIAARFLAQATARGLAAAVDDGRLYPPDLARAGVALERLLVVPAERPLEIARAADILLRSRVFGVVLLPQAPLRTALWSRLRDLAQKAAALLLVVGTQAESDLASFASARLHCTIERVSWTGAPGPFCELAGYEIGARVLKRRRAIPGTVVRVRALAKRGDAL